MFHLVRSISRTTPRTLATGSRHALWRSSSVFATAPHRRSMASGMPKEKIDRMLLESVQFVQHNNTRKAKKLLTKAVEEYRNINEQTGVVNALNTLGLLHAREKDYLQCIDVLSECLETARTLDQPEVVGKLCGQLGAAFAEVGKLDLAIEKTSEALPLAVAHKDKHAQAMAHMNLGSLHSPQRNPDGVYATAVQHFEDAKRLFEDLGDQEDMVTRLTALVAEEHAQAGHLDLSNNAWDDVLQLCESKPSSTEEWQAYMGLAQNYARLGPEHDKLCLDSFKEAYTLASVLGNQNFVLFTFQRYASALYARRMIDEAIELGESVLSATKALPDEDPSKVGTLLQAHLMLGRFSEADPVRGEQHFAEARSLSEKHTLAQATTFFESAEYYTSTNQAALAVDYYQKAIKAATQPEERTVKAAAMMGLGVQLMQSNDEKNAIEALEQASSMFETIPGGELSLLNALTLLGRAYRAVGQSEDAEKILARSVSLANVLHDRGMLTELPEELRVKPEQ